MGIVFMTSDMFITLVIQARNTYFVLWDLAAKGIILFFSPIKVFSIAFYSGRLVVFLQQVEEESTERIPSV